MIDLKCENCGKKLVFKTTEDLLNRLILGWMHYSAIKLSNILGTRVSRNDLRGLATCECGEWYVVYHKKWSRKEKDRIARIKGHDTLYNAGRMEFTKTI